MSEKTELKDLILQKEKEGRVCFMGVDEIIEADLEDFIRQPIEGLLYDLNRNKQTILTFLDDPKWVNDHAVMLVITKLKEYFDKHQEKV